MRILVTGGAGFLGSHLSEFLLKKGHTIICMDNLLTGTINNIKHLLKNKNFKFIRQDITKSINIKGKLDAVFHFASPSSPIDYLKYPIQTLEVGALGTHNCLKLAKERKATFFLASTSEVYGDPLEHPQKEDYWGNVNPIGLRSVYNEAKRFAETLTMAYHRYHKVDIRIARIFNTFGPGMRKNDGRVIPNFIFQALENKPLTIYGNGLQTRSFCYVSDLIEGIYKLFLAKICEPVNLGNSEEISILELAELIIKLTKSKSKIIYQPLPEDDPKCRKPDITKARKLLRWQPKYDFEGALKKTINLVCEKSFFE